ncbi:hypothetical protein, partial [Sphingobacterium multivorum]|uniref:hypothetical protein n=1 Tax=Sphingobacterium multivorum TaxID=28454 RepID=UPI00289637D3
PFFTRKPLLETVKGFFRLDTCLYFPVQAIAYPPPIGYRSTLLEFTFLIGYPTVANYTVSGYSSCYKIHMLYGHSTLLLSLIRQISLYPHTISHLHIPIRNPITLYF